MNIDQIISMMTPPEPLALRDYFAASAIPAIMEDLTRNTKDDVDAEVTRQGCATPHALVAKQAYAIADAMVAERTKAST